MCSKFNDSIDDFCLSAAEGVDGIMKLGALESQVELKLGRWHVELIAKFITTNQQNTEETETDGVTYK